MGTSQSTEEKARLLEKQLLSASELDLEKELQILDIEIDYLGKNYIHTLKCASNTGKILVMLHGYGGSSVFYYKMLKQLSRFYDIYCIDLLGMGLSSRPEFKCETTEETIYFFLESIEKWRIAIGLEKFYLCGHSFGGYMASHYANLYSSRVDGLILFSPLGFTKDSLDCRYLESETYINNLSFMHRRFHNMRMDFFKKKLTPSELVDKYGWLLGFWIRRNLSKRLRLDSEIGKILWEFLCTVYSLPMSSEKALHYIINPNIVAYIPLEDIIIDMDMNVTVFYGDKDWMCKKGAKRMLEKESKKTNFNVINVNDCGHQMTMENPIELIRNVVDIVETWVEISLKNKHKVHDIDSSLANEIEKINI